MNSTLPSRRDLDMLTTTLDYQKFLEDHRQEEQEAIRGILHESGFPIGGCLTFLALLLVCLACWAFAGVVGATLFNLLAGS